MKYIEHCWLKSREEFAESLDAKEACLVAEFADNMVSGSVIESPLHSEVLSGQPVVARVAGGAPQLPVYKEKNQKRDNFSKSFQHDTRYRAVEHGAPHQSNPVLNASSSHTARIIREYVFAVVQMVAEAMRIVNTFMSKYVSSNNNSHGLVLSPRRKWAQAHSKLAKKVTYTVLAPFPYAVTGLLVLMIAMIFVDVMPISLLVCIFAILMILMVVLGNHMLGRPFWVVDELPPLTLPGIIQPAVHEDVSCPDPPPPTSAPTSSCPQCGSTAPYLTIGTVNITNSYTDDGSSNNSFLEASTGTAQRDREMSIELKEQREVATHAHNSCEEQHHCFQHNQHYQRPLWRERELSKHGDEEEELVTDDGIIVGRRRAVTIQINELGEEDFGPLTKEDILDNLNSFYEHLFASIDYNLLIIFLGLFIVIDNLSSTGVPKAIWNQIVGDKPFQTAGSVIGISAFVLISSQFLGNVPVIQLAKPNVEVLGDNAKRMAWAVLSFVATVGGNLTITGSAGKKLIIMSISSICLFFFKVLFCFVLFCFVLFCFVFLFALFEL
jgi:hypothetical protein